MRSAYWLAAALLGAHEVDAAFWREWELLRLPGGPDLFVALHVGIFLLMSRWQRLDVEHARQLGVEAPSRPRA